MVKKLPAIQETWIQSLGWEDSLKKGIATHSSILARRIPWTEKAGGLQSMGSQRVVHNWVTNTFHFQVGHSFSSKEQASFHFMAAVTICSDFGAQRNKVCHYLYCFPIYLPWSDGIGCHDLSFLNVELWANVFTVPQTLLNDKPTGYFSNLRLRKTFVYIMWNPEVITDQWMWSCKK